MHTSPRFLACRGAVSEQVIVADETKSSVFMSSGTRGALRECILAGKSITESCHRHTICNIPSSKHCDLHTAQKHFSQCTMNMSRGR